MEKIFYFAHILGALNTLATVILVFAIVAVICFVAWYVVDELYEVTSWNEDEAHTCKKWLKTSILTLVLSVLGIIFVPSKQTYLFMVGGHALEEIAANEKVQERASKTIDLLDKYLEEKVKDTDSE